MGIQLGEHDVEDPVRVKHLIEYLQGLDPELPVYIEDCYFDTDEPWDSEQDLIKNSGAFHVEPGYLKIGPDR